MVFSKDPILGQKTSHMTMGTNCEKTEIKSWDKQFVLR